MKRPSRRRLTRALIRELCQRVKAGAFMHTAAESLGVPREALTSWLAPASTEDKNRALRRELANGLSLALGHARVMAEIEMRTEQPKVWLLHGPGKETPSAPGWSAPVRSAQPAVDDAVERGQICEHLLNGLRDKPEMRTFVSGLLQPPIARP